MVTVTALAALSKQPWALRWLVSTRLSPTIVGAVYLFALATGTAEARTARAQRRGGTHGTGPFG
jgi:hypothetical protein